MSARHHNRSFRHESQTQHRLPECYARCPRATCGAGSTPVHSSLRLTLLGTTAVAARFGPATKKRERDYRCSWQIGQRRLRPSQNGRPGKALGGKRRCAAVLVAGHFGGMLVDGLAQGGPARSGMLCSKPIRSSGHIAQRASAASMRTNSFPLIWSVRLSLYPAGPMTRLSSESTCSFNGRHFVLPAASLGGEAATVVPAM